MVARSREAPRRGLTRARERVRMSFFNAFVLRPLPVREPEALVNALDRGRPHNFSIVVTSGG